MAKTVVSVPRNFAQCDLPLKIGLELWSRYKITKELRYNIPLFGICARPGSARRRGTA